MKKIILLSLLCFSQIFSYAQSTPKSNVRKIEGIPVYVLSEPDVEYSVIGKVSDQDATSILNAVSGTPTIRSIIDQAKIIISNALRKQRKGKIDEFDAIIIDDDGHVGTCIKYKK
jgi:hypothetical protein